jgi:hypothetical protein
VNQEIFFANPMPNAARIRRCEQWHHACYRSRSFARSPSWTAGKNTHRTCGRRQFTPPVMPCNGPHARPAEQGRHKHVWYVWKRCSPLCFSSSQTPS